MGPSRLISALRFPNGAADPAADYGRRPLPPPPLVRARRCCDRRQVARVRTLGNVLWLLCPGRWLAIGYGVSGATLCLTIIGIPFGLQAFKLRR
jgi:hypothetical protein